ncbi:MAG: sodium:proton antiporter [Ruminococcaceae bacterium]|nr:sodium:proton antiporter [Oscillospiraceae bacterium]
METLLALSIAMFMGLMMSRVAKKLGLPAVTSYLVAGILIGPYCLGRLGISGIGFVSSADVKTYDVLQDAALGFIAFAMGNEFRLSELKKVGKAATVIAVFQALVATLFVDVALYCVHLAIPEKLPLGAVITLGAVATATAPAATLMVVKQYKAEGPLTRMLLPVVALDDVVGLIVFAVSFGIAKALSHGAVDMISVIVNPLIEVVLSLALGFVLGLGFHLSEKFFHSNSKRMSISITFVFLAVALSTLKFHIGPVEIAFSSLLVCMMLGTVFCNLCDFSEELMDRVDKWTAPLMILFFVISGADLEFSVLSDIAIILVGIVYIIARSAGKILGASVSAGFMKCEPTIKKYLGVTLLPQAGVALGMSMTAMELGEVGLVIRNVALMAVLIYELFGPLFTKIALEKAGEIKEKPIPPRVQAEMAKKK